MIFIIIFLLQTKQRNNIDEIINFIAIADKINNVDIYSLETFKKLFS